MTTLAIFDLDHTLIPADSDHGWGAFLVRHGYVDASEHKAMNDYFYEQYQAGSMNVLEYCEFSFQVFAKNDMATLNQWHEQFMNEFVNPVIHPQALELVQRHKDAGHIPVLISSTNEFVITPIAQKLGFTHIIGTRPEMKDGRYTGNVAGVPSFQAGKITRINEWLTEQGLGTWDDLACTFFYSDSMNDLPLLEKATFPVVTNPDERLQALALARHWMILELFAGA
ncbi:haloacid dehalogenase [Formosimonas limnophila]|uniref:Haloacid dehalogenase n=1 Tax=Formosimonas limnophila TaxID=1384487 RepID=A0A8J3CFQ2_9BURK|nr:HAD family hydrolase [Formosimonas limnophila]GHA65620.1 haloacid dehalogenase [Formosimonas limnophila]